MVTTDEFLVVGGGIGGLAAGLALARAGRRVRVLERAPEFGEVGAGLQLAPNATRLLAEWGLLDPLSAVGWRPRRIVLGDAVSGRELVALDLTGPFIERYHAPYLVAHRSDLLDLLLAACRTAGVCLEPGRDVTRVVADDAGVTVHCADSTEYRAAAVVGADGLHSRLRGLVSDDEPVGSGYVAYRGAIPMEDARHRADLDDVIAWIGPGLHFVQYAVRAGALYNQVAVFRSAGYARGDADWGNAAELRERFDAMCEHVAGAARSIRLDQRWPMYDREPIGSWTAHGRVVLLGDAAHPMLQYLAQGACQAIEDADALARAVRGRLGEQPVTADALAAAFADYEAERVARTARVQRNARLWGDIWHVDGVGARIRNDSLARRRPDDFSSTDWLYGASAQLRASTPEARR
jgi:salicylate hydroxylase